MSRRPRAAALAVLAVLAAAGLVLYLTTRGDDAPPPPPPDAGAVPVVPGTPDWGDFPGSPPPLEVPPGGRTVTTPDGGISVTRPDGTLFVEVGRGPAGEPVEVRYHDAAGRLRVVINRLAEPPTRAIAAQVAAARARPRCVERRRSSGWTWRGVIGWRANLDSVPRHLRRADALAAVRAGRVTWVRNTNRCRERDASAARFAYRGATRVPVGRNGVSTVGFGEVDRLGGVCVGALACTITFLRGSRAIESDIRMDRNPRRRFTTVPRGGGVDLQAVVVHETGHTLGFDHVDSPDNVMNAYLPAGDRSARVLGRGDARINNARY